MRHLYANSRIWKLTGMHTFLVIWSAEIPNMMSPFFWKRKLPQVQGCHQREDQNPTFFNIIYWVAGSILSSIKCLMVQVLFWKIENEMVGCWLGLRHSKTLCFYFCKVIEKWKINCKDFCREFCKNLEKNKIKLETSGTREDRPLQPS